MTLADVGQFLPIFGQCSRLGNLKSGKLGSRAGRAIAQCLLALSTVTIGLIGVGAVLPAPASAQTAAVPPWNPSLGWHYTWAYTSCSNCGEWGVDVPLPYQTAIKAPEASTVIGYQRAQNSCYDWAPGRLLLRLDRGGVIGFGHVTPVVTSGPVIAGQEIATVGPTQQCDGGMHVEFMYAPNGCSTSSCYTHTDFRCSPGCGPGTAYPLSDPLSPWSLLQSYMTSAPGGANAPTIAFQANTGVLGINTNGAPASWTNTGLGMAAGTSPAIAALPGGYEVAFQANAGVLGINTNGAPASWTNTGLGMAAGTSLSITG